MGNDGETAGKRLHSSVPEAAEGDGTTLTNRRFPCAANSRALRPFHALVKNTCERDHPDRRESFCGRGQRCSVHERRVEAFWLSILNTLSSDHSQRATVRNNSAY